MSEDKIDTTGAAERMKKYRKKNQLKNGLTIAIAKIQEGAVAGKWYPRGEEAKTRCC